MKRLLVIACLISLMLLLTGCKKPIPQVESSFKDKYEDAISNLFDEYYITARSLIIYDSWVKINEETRIYYDNSNENSNDNNNVYEYYHRIYNGLAYKRYEEDREYLYLSSSSQRNHFYYKFEVYDNEIIESYEDEIDMIYMLGDWDFTLNEDNVYTLSKPYKDLFEEYRLAFRLFMHSAFYDDYYLFEKDAIENGVVEISIYFTDEDTIEKIIYDMTGVVEYVGDVLCHKGIEDYYCNVEEITAQVKIDFDTNYLSFDETQIEQIVFDDSGSNLLNTSIIPSFTLGEFLDIQLEYNFSFDDDLAHVYVEESGYYSFDAQDLHAKPITLYDEYLDEVFSLKNKSFFMDDTFTVYLKTGDYFILIDCVSTKCDRMCNNNLQISKVSVIEDDYVGFSSNYSILTKIDESSQIHFTQDYLGDLDSILIDGSVQTITITSDDSHYYVFTNNSVTIDYINGEYIIKNYNNTDFVIYFTLLFDHLDDYTVTITLE